MAFVRPSIIEISQPWALCHSALAVIAQEEREISDRTDRVDIKVVANTAAQPIQRTVQLKDAEPRVCGTRIDLAAVGFSYSCSEVHFREDIVSESLVEPLLDFNIVVSGNDSNPSFGSKFHQPFDNLIRLR